ncbi:hypothetical protein RB195_015065 [Necator americanus]|uniref:Uncharacterized protein n=1 Tax=Necator americanus TaxID=51031 RepID=A0ABR1E2T6_NECAM
MNRGILLAFLLISSLVTVEGGLGRSLKKRLKSIGRPFERGAKQAAEIAAAGAVAKVAAGALSGRRKRSEDEGAYGNVEENSLKGLMQWDGEK